MNDVNNQLLPNHKHFQSLGKSRIVDLFASHGPYERTEKKGTEAKTAGEAYMRRKQGKGL